MWMTFLVLMLFPFWEVIGGWVSWWKPGFVVLVGLLVIKEWLARPPQLPGPQWTKWASGLWLALIAIKTPNWDFSVGILETWLVAGAVGLLVIRCARVDSDRYTQLALGVWGLALLIAVLNPFTQSDPQEILARASEVSSDPLMQKAVVFAALQPRYHFPFGNPNDLGLFLVLPILATPLFVSWVKRKTGSTICVLAVWLGTAVQLKILWETRSRTALLALLVGVLASLGRYWLVHRESAGSLSPMRHAKNVRYALLLLVVVMVVLGGVVLYSSVGREMLQRSETVKARLIYYQASLQMIRDYPLTGTGLGGFAGLYPGYRTLTPEQSQFPHNLLLELPLYGGAIALLIVLYWVVLLVQKFGRTIIRSAYLGGLLATGVGTMLGFPHNTINLAPLLVFWCVGGAIPTRAAEPETSGCYPRPRFHWSLVLPLLLVAMFGARELGHHYFDQAEQCLRQRNCFHQVLPNLKRSVQVWPVWAQPHFFLARTYLLRGQFGEAEQAYQQALKWEPRSPYLHSEIAAYYWQTNQIGKAFKNQYQAVLLHPVKWQYQDQLARWLSARGHDSLAQHYLQQSEYLKQFEPSYDQALQALLDNTP